MRCESCSEAVDCYSVFDNDGFRAGVYSLCDECQAKPNLRTEQTMKCFLVFRSGAPKSLKPWRDIDLTDGKEAVQGILDAQDGMGFIRGLKQARKASVALSRDEQVGGTMKEHGQRVECNERKHITIAAVILGVTAYDSCSHSQNEPSLFVLSLPLLFMLHHSR